MKRLLLFATGIALSVSIASAEHHNHAPAMDDPKMKAWAEAAQPGEMHKLLQQYVGVWNHTVRWWMKPDTDPEVSRGTTTITSILGDRFIKQQVKGVSMGKPFEGIGITGYDNVKKHFAAIWMDTMGTGMMKSTATLNEEKDAIVEKGEYSCPMSDSGERPFRATWTLPTNDSYTYTMYSTDNEGNEFKMMEITYTKAS